MPHVLLVLSDPAQRAAYAEALRALGLRTHEVSCSRTALRELRRRPYSVVVSDLFAAGDHHLHFPESVRNASGGQNVWVIGLASNVFRLDDDAAHSIGFDHICVHRTDPHWLCEAVAAGMHRLGNTAYRQLTLVRDSNHRWRLH